MVGPVQKRPESPPKRSSHVTNGKVMHDIPQWIEDMIIENYEKYGVPLNALELELKRIEESGVVSDPFKPRTKKTEANEQPQPVNGQQDERTVDTPRKRTKATTVTLDADGPQVSSTQTPTNTGSSTSPITVLDVAGDDVEDEYHPLALPEWYTKIKTSGFRWKKLNIHPTRDENQAIKALESMKTCIANCEHSPYTQLPQLHKKLRDDVHKAEVILKIDALIIRKTRMLHEDSGLPRIFASTKAEFPWDLRADAWQLYKRWHSEIFEADLLRGIRTRQGRDRTADSIDPSWKDRFCAKFYGQGDLVLGQWWPTQLTLVRDGAHGSSQGGIFGEKDKGAYSIVLSGIGNTKYDDKDNGNDIWYSGTDGRDFKATENTLRMIETCDTIHNQVRVFRSHQLPKSNIYRPEVGMRYDGLYSVVEKKLVDREKQTYVFRLVRCGGQHPIRHENNAVGRPTQFEIMEDVRLRRDGR